jgi:hypothetical protein
MTAKNSYISDDLLILSEIELFLSFGEIPSSNSSSEVSPGLLFT